MIRQYVEKPLKVQAEQYLAAASPPAAGVCTEPHPPFLDGQPHVHVAGAGPTAVYDTDMIVWSAYDEDVIMDVQPLAEFEDRYGNVPGEVA
jgi:hypothetical protein